MNAPPPDSPNKILRETAAHWTVRRDRGLSSAESIEYELWLAADERHAAAMKSASAAWSLLDRMPERAAAPVLAAATRRRSFWRRTVAFSTLAAAAALVLGVLIWRRPADAPLDNRPLIASVAMTSPQTVTLSDGSLVQLNTGGEIVERFTPAERLVLLTHGEAHFAVTKNPARPFVVRAGTLQVRAVGTAFNVRLQTSAVDVIVTEGRVQLTASSASSNPQASRSDPAAPTLGAGQRAVLRSELASVAADFAHALIISNVDATEIARVLAWREPLLRLGGSTLAELAVEFEHRTGRRVILADPSLAPMRVGGRFRADDPEGFTHLLATTLDLDVERAADGTITLRKKTSESR